jgi:hypothetical protein
VDLFVYGTLLFPEVLAALLGRVPVRTPAVATGWRVAALPGRVYPGLVPAENGRANGLVISGLTRAEGRILDAYEDADYQLTVITLADGRSCPTYVWRTDVLAHDWNPHGFAVEHLARYVEHCARWRGSLLPTAGR